MADSKEKLFSDFSPVSTEQWKREKSYRRPERGGFREETRLEDKRRI